MTDYKMIRKIRRAKIGEVAHVASTNGILVTMDGGFVFPKPEMKARIDAFYAEIAADTEGWYGRCLTCRKEEFNCKCEVNEDE